MRERWNRNEFFKVLIIDFGHLQLGQNSILEGLEQFAFCILPHIVIVNIWVHRIIVKD